MMVKKKRLITRVLIKKCLKHRLKWKECHCNNTNLFKDYVSLTSGKISYREIFKTYDITHVLMEKDNFLNKSMEYDDHLKVIYQDDIFVLYEVVEKY